MRYVNGARVIEIVAAISGGFRVRIVEDADPESVGYEWEITASELGSCYNPVYQEPDPTD